MASKNGSANDFKSPSLGGGEVVWMYLLLSSTRTSCSTANTATQTSSTSSNSDIKLHSKGWTKVDNFIHLPFCQLVKESEVSREQRSANRTSMLVKRPSEWSIWRLLSKS
eukprot:2403112-Amphidinium_carterae.2